MPGGIRRGFRERQACRALGTSAKTSTSKPWDSYTLSPTRNVHVRGGHRHVMAAAGRFPSQGGHRVNRPPAAARRLLVNVVEQESPCPFECLVIQLQHDSRMCFFLRNRHTLDTNSRSTSGVASTLLHPWGVLV